MLNSLDANSREQFAKVSNDRYRRALGHSARVRRLKILLPLCAALLSLGFVAVSIVRTYLPESIKIAGADIEDGKVVMSRPAIAGRNTDGASYSMNALRALQDIKNPNLITLETITAKVPVSEGDMADIRAERGTYDRASDRFVLDKPFDINMASGMTARFQSGDLDIKAGKLKTKDPVSINTKEASIVAQSMDMTDKGQIITLTGAVRMTISGSALQKQGN
ncbi:LPS export ABC transporter periplasmic protein LptC [Allorhizobium undicola]|uniref:LPS export ABC transporter periplasmic protein LptC n=1 Tax=Allorhizobium undicola TaxID=78527 RepID=UPI0004899709